MASGCVGCSGDGVYAEIIQVMANRTLENGFSGIVVEDAVRTGVAVGDKLELNVYACPIDAAPIKLSADQIEVTPSEHTTYANGIVTVGDGATGTETIRVKMKGNEKFTATLNITIGG